MRLVNTLNTRYSGQLILTLGAAIFLNGLGFVSGALLARLLGPVGRGEWAAIQLWASFWATLALVGTPDAVIYFVGKMPSEYGHSWVSGTILSLLVGLPITVFGVISLTWLLREQSSQVIHVAKWYTVGLFILFAINWMPLSMLRGLNQFGLWNFFRIFPSIAWTAVVISAYFFKVTSLEYLAKNFIIFYAVVGLITFFSLLFNGYKPAYPKIREWFNMLRFSLPSALSTLTKSLVQSGRVAQLIAAIFVSSEELGYIFVAITWSNLVIFIPQVIASVVYPRISSSSNDEMVVVEVKRGMQSVVTVVILISVIQIIVTPIAIPLIFSRQYLPSISVGMLLIVAAAFSGIRQVANDSLRGLGKPHISFLTELVSVFMTIMMLVLLISRYGFIGVAISMAIGDASSVIFAVYALAHYANISIVELIIPNKAMWVKYLERVLGK